MQTTLDRPITLTGVALHSGRAAAVTLRPAAAGAGIVFARSDLDAGAACIPARWDATVPSALCTRLANPSGATLSTVEHVMAALAGCGVHNARVEVTGPEMPILDGSARPLVRAIREAGLRRLDAPLALLQVLRPVEVRDGAATARLEPAEGLVIDFAIDFPDPAIGRQALSLDMANGTFLRDLADARTFCRAGDVSAMQARGLARGGSLLNAVVVDGAQVVNPGGLRHRDEFVRHKMLDALGDLALAGGPVLGRYVGRRAGHALTNRLLHALFDSPGAARWIACDADRARRLPGFGLRPGDLPAVA